MPNQHYRCPACGATDLITYTVADTARPDWPPRCADCDVPMEMAPRQMLTDLRTDGEGDRPFQKFSVVVDGRRVTIDSLSKMRQIERDSEQRYRNGEGEPIRFRMWNNEASNKDVNSFGDRGTIGGQQYSTGEQPGRREKIGVRRYGERKPRITVAKGAGQTALGD